MTDRGLEAKSRLVALARKKAERNGTTLESKVEQWLTRYINEPDDANDKRIDDNSLPRVQAPQAIIARAVESINKTSPPSVRSGSDTRSAAYRRLLGVMGDSSKRTSGS